MREYQVGDYVAMPGDGDTIYPSFHLIKEITNDQYIATVYTFDLEFDKPRLMEKQDQVLSKFIVLEQFGLKIKADKAFHQTYGI